MSTALIEIRAIDNTLKILREEWLEAKADTKGKWMRRIDEQLDKRLEAMKRRNQP